MDILIINGYAGSLTIAASQLGLRIRGSYEDSGYGLLTQQLNFPDLVYIEKLPWPKQDLSKTMVIAHPPCAAFSRQNTTGQKGTGADSFKCHVNVMRYALSQKALALAIESVPAFLVAAKDIHEQMVKKYEYNLYRIRQNTVTFGVPQWRERAWIIFTRLPKFILHHHPQVRNVENILLPAGTPPPVSYEITGFLKCMESAGWTRERVWKEFIEGEDTGAFLQIAQRQLGIDDPGPNHEEVRKRFNLKGRLGSKLPRILNTEEFCSTILRDSNFFVRGRELYVEEYLQAMGYPIDYKFHDVKRFKEYLSKGVCPPVAKWILEQTILNLKGHAVPWIKGAGYRAILKPGETADFTVKRKGLKQRDLFMENLT